MQTQAQAISGRGRDLNDALGNLAPFAEDTADIVSILNKQEGAVSRLIANTGVVFGALSERDGQLRSLIENTNSVFSTTASRDSELQAAFRALPTFEKESRLTFDRLDEFARETDPLITQLRPAARELSPTLRDLEDISPDLRNLLEQLQPLIDASVKGFPAAEKTLEDLRPLVAQLDPATAQLAPAVDFIGGYKRELTSFFANTAAATQATGLPTGVHYLRTSNPLNPENLAVYPKRLPTNRPNPYRLPGGFDELNQGLAVYENRQCVASNLVPSIVNTPLQLVNDVIAGRADRDPVAGRDDRGRRGPAAADRAAADPAGAAHARAGRGADPGRAAAAHPGLRVRRDDGRGRRLTAVPQAGAVRRSGASSTQYPQLVARSDGK